MTKQTTPETPTAAECCIVVQNDILGTRTETYSPQSAEDALRCHGLVSGAHEFVRWLNFAGPEEADAEPLGVSIRHNDDTIIVHWHIVGDPEAARIVMREVLAGTWSPWE